MNRGAPINRRRDLARRGGGGGPLTKRLEAIESRELALPSPDDSTELAPSTLAPQPEPERWEKQGRDTAGFHPGSLSIVETPASPIAIWVYLAIFALFASALAWGYFGKIASYTSAVGKIQAAGRTKVLEALAKGQVIKIQVRDGDVVKTGTVLVQLDPTEAAADRTIIDQKLTDLRAESLRRNTEIGAVRGAKIGAEVTLETKPKVPWGADVPAAVRTREEGVAAAELSNLAARLKTLLSQKHAKEAERDKYIKSIVAQKALLAITQENMTMIDGLQQKGYNSKAQYLDYKAKLDGQQVNLTGLEGSLENAKQAILVLDSQIATTRESFVTSNTQSIAAAEQTIVDLAQQLVRANQTLTNMTLRSPTDGTVHAMAVTTIGQVVKPGQQLMQIVPTDAPIEIEAYVANTDIGFLRVGDRATVKVDAFKYGVYGAIDAIVISLSSDSLPATSKSSVQSASLDGEYNAMTAAQKTGNIQFPVILRTVGTTMRIDGRDAALTPGMGVNVEIETERRRALDYIVSPILELLSTAGHEK